MRAGAWLITIMAGISLPVMPLQADTQEARIPDIFNGMVVTDRGELFLERCDGGKTPYRLTTAQDADAGDPLKQLRGKDGLVQAQLIARYRADGDGHVLEVLWVERIQTGKTCHLEDALEAYFSGHVVKPDPDADKDRWEALALGSVAPESVEVIGKGYYAYRFVLLHPRTGKPVPDTDFALSASRKSDYALPFVADDKKVFQGRTDGQGQTPVFLLPERLPDATFDLRERFGSGPFGETFHLTDHYDNDLFNMPYVLMTCTTPPRYFRGYTYPNGDTAYTASDGPINIRLLTLDDVGEPLPTSCDDGKNKDGEHSAEPAPNVKTKK